MAQWEELAASGLTGLSLPEEFGGGGGMLELCIACERLAAGGYPAAKLIVSTAMAGTMIARHGTPEQQERWLPGIASGRNRFCFAFTEPEAGSNANNLLTTATPTGNGFSVTGAKTYISALESSETMIVVARDAESGGLTLLVLPTPCENVGDAGARRRAGVRAPVERVLRRRSRAGSRCPGRAGQGRAGAVRRAQPRAPRRRLAGRRSGRWSLDKATAYAKERVVFDVPIGTHQAVQHPLAESLIGLEAAWGLTEAAARLFDTGEPAGLESNMAKIAARHGARRGRPVAAGASAAAAIPTRR